jgi:hypothetical protein
MMRALEGRAEALAGTFNAYASMGREPGEGLVRALKERGRRLSRDRILNPLLSLAKTIIYLRET